MANPKLEDAVSKRPGEPVFKDELALNTATLATLAMLQKDSSQSAQLQQFASEKIQRAISLDDEIISRYPNNIVFWKNRVRIFYTLSQLNPQYLVSALEAMKQVSILSPTDAKVFYNLGILYRSLGDLPNARIALQKSVGLKPNYRDAYFGLGQTLYEIGSKNGATDQSLKMEGIAKLKYILDDVSPQDKEVQQVLSSWNAL